MNKYTHTPRDPLQELFARKGGVIGADLRCAKGAWTLSDEPIETGDGGLKICMLAPTARHGERQWRDGVGNKYRDVQLYTVDTPSDERLDLGWDPFTQFQAIARDEGHAGLLLTFTSTSWGGRNAVESLVCDYVGNGRRKFPVVTLGSRPKKNDDGKGNFDPVFSIGDWVVASDFTDTLADLLPPPAAAQPLALGPPKRTGPESDEGLEPGADPGDDIPF